MNTPALSEHLLCLSDSDNLQKYLRPSPRSKMSLSGGKTKLKNTVPTMCDHRLVYLEATEPRPSSGEVLGWLTTFDLVS